jgi:RNA polymerase sigma-70 factor, ECF subfamily
MSIDLALIARIKQRDAGALAELYDRYATRVFSLCVAILHDDGAAQEATQDVFMKVWAQPERYHYDDNRFAAWLLMIARHRAIDQLRRDKRRVSDSFSLDDETFPELPDLHTDEQARWREMRQVMDALPREQRIVIELAYYYGLSQSEIAEHLSTPLGTIKTRMRLAMDKLRLAITRE